MSQLTIPPAKLYQAVLIGNIEHQLATFDVSMASCQLNEAHHDVVR